MKFIHTLKEEIIHTIPAIIYFTIAFNLIFYTSGLPLGPDDIRHFNTFTVTLCGLFMGKILIIANSFPFLNAFSHKPLVYNITWKFFIYMLFILILWVLENFIHLVYIEKNISISTSFLEMDFYSPVFWSSFLWLAIIFLIYLVFSELTRAIGKEKIRRILFGK